MENDGLVLDPHDFCSNLLKPWQKFLHVDLEETAAAIDLEFLIKKVLESMHFILFTALFP